MAQQVVHGRKIEIHLAGIFRLERGVLQLDHHIAAQAQVIEEQVEVEVVAFYLQVDLPAHESEADAQFKKKPLNVLKEPLLDLPLSDVTGQGKEIKGIRVLEGLLRQVGLRRRKGPLEVGDGLALALVKAGLDLMDQHGPAPAVLDGLMGIPEALDGVGELRQQLEVLPPGYLSNRRWEILSVQFSNDPLENCNLRGPCQMKGAHVPDILPRESADPGEFPLKVARQTFYDISAPAFVALAFDDGLADLPIEFDEPTIDGKRGLDLGGTDAGFDVREECGVAGGDGGSSNRLSSHYGVAELHAWSSQGTPAPIGRRGPAALYHTYEAGPKKFPALGAYRGSRRDLGRQNRDFCVWGEKRLKRIKPRKGARSRKKL